jgi:hypothetical protein
VNSPEIQLTDSIWESLKIVIIIFAALAPFVIAFLVIRSKRKITKLKTKHQANQKTLEKRIEIYDRMGPMLNDLFCFFCYNGNWKELTPIDIMGLKRELDKDINVYAPLFSEELSLKYMAFIQLCFVAHSGWEHEEKIKSLYELRQQHAAEWNDDWILFFDTNNVLDAIKMKEHYDELIDSFKKDLSTMV